MSFHSKAKERPQARKRFLTAREVSEMGTAGVRQIAVGADLVITDAARETAIDFGISLVPEKDTDPKATGRPAQRSSTGTTDGLRLRAAKTGRQETVRRPLAVAPIQGPRNGEIIEAMVNAFRRAGRHAPSEREVREVAARVLTEGKGSPQGRD